MSITSALLDFILKLATFLATLYFVLINLLYNEDNF